MKHPLGMIVLYAGAMASAYAAPPKRPPITGLSHIAVYASNPVKSERFYVHDLGAVKGVDVEQASGMRYYFAPTQFVEVLPLPQGWTSFSRLDHVAFTTADANGLRQYLIYRHVNAVSRVRRGSDGSSWFDVKDPEGNDIQFVQPPARPLNIPVNPLSRHIIHVGFIIHDRALEDTFYRGVLGFRPYWYGGPTDTSSQWVAQQVPNGTDWVEYMVVGAPHGRGIPTDMKQSDVGVLDHFSLGVRNVEAAYNLLWNGDRLRGQDNLPKIGRDAKWQLNLYDPDGTRAEIMELHAMGKPCCSPFTASDPTY
jgi:catechol 2,3-dioxygenase-like lactoylglutathione lyase family enzyme